VAPYGSDIGFDDTQGQFHLKQPRTLAVQLAFHGMLRASRRNGR